MKPARVSFNRLALKNLKKLLLDNYDFLPKEVKEIRGRVKRNGIFQVSNGKKKRIFKYFGDNGKRIESIAKISEKLYPLFPLIEKTNSGEYYVSLEDGLYIFEEFVQGKVGPERNLKYFSNLGETSALMHDSLLQFIKENPDLGKEFLSDTKYLSESNLISLAIDLSSQGHFDITDFQKFEELKREIESLPDYFIHGDLNNSNVVETLWGLRFIDLERIKRSKRIFEFESPLIFSGDMNVPVYIPRSITSLVKGYSKQSSEKIKDSERHLAKILLEYSLIKNFVIRNIRRKEKENTKQNLLENICLLKKD